MSLKLLTELRTRKVGSSTLRAVLKSLCFFMNEETEQCNPSLNALLRDTEITKKTLLACLSELESKGIIVREKGTFTSTTKYKVNLEILPYYELKNESKKEINESETEIKTQKICAEKVADIETKNILSDNVTSSKFSTSDTFIPRSNFTPRGKINPTMVGVNLHLGLGENYTYGRSIFTPRVGVNLHHKKKYKENIKEIQNITIKPPTPEVGNPAVIVQNSKTPLLENISQPKVEESEFFLTGESEQKTKAAVKTKSKARTHKFDLEELPDKWREYCQFMRAELDPERTFVEFKFYYTQGNGQDVLRSDKGWSQCWQGWIRRHQQTKNQFLDNPNLGKGTTVPSNNSLAENCPQDKIIACYHEVLPNHPPVLMWNTEKRINQLRNFWRSVVIENEITEEQKGLNTVKWVFEKVKYATSLNGQNENGYRADLEFITSEDKLPRIIEGYYDKKPQQHR